MRPNNAASSLFMSYAALNSKLFDSNHRFEALIGFVLFFLLPGFGYYLILERVPFIIDSPLGGRTLASVLALASTIFSFLILG